MRSAEAIALFLIDPSLGVVEQAMMMCSVGSIYTSYYLDKPLAIQVVASTHYAASNTSNPFSLYIQQPQNTNKLHLPLSFTVCSSTEQQLHSMVTCTLATVRSPTMLYIVMVFSINQ